MYEAYFGLREKPFVMTPDTRYFFPSSKHTDALNHMVYAIQERRGFVVITGEIGCGKTTLSRILLQKLEPSTKTAIIRNTQLTAKDLVMSALDEYEIPYDPARTKASLINRLNEFLIEQLRENNNVVLLIDEAQNLTPTVLEEVRMLSNLETEREKLIQIILMGQPELKQKLWLKQLTQLRQRVTLLYHLSALDEAEVGAYIMHRLRAGGSNQPIFASETFARIYQLTQGVPRLINALCDRALLTGYVNEYQTIDNRMIDEAAAELPALMEQPGPVVRVEQRAIAPAGQPVMPAELPDAGDESPRAMGVQA